MWQGGAPILATQDALDLLPALLGDAAETTSAVAPDALIGALEADRTALGILPFDLLDPRFKVLTVDGVNLLSNQLTPESYPLIAAGAGGNRDASKLTTLVVTGVTAMARGTGAAIERAGRTTYPAEIIGPELALADITHVSNEIPFLEDCIVENYENNLILCSHTSYWDALELMGTDIVGLSGNHVNDFGREGARESLTWYKENDIPIYGSGFTVDEACAPLLWEDHGNTFAFIAALAYGPESAWVTDEEPGACYYYEHKERILNTVKLLSQAVDIVSVELQYEETYFPWPTPSQVEEFRELRATGADIVSGVQSHVPQAQEPYGTYDVGGPGMISYGLGNLYFDQMWSWETRTELYARHAIYDGKVISTEILTGVLEDFAQPRWTTAEERADLLETIFDAAPERP
jgi:poly-gamma-glutamate synthesis protein (capsule biosynthesis protein)